MKFERDLHIINETVSQKESIIKILINFGFKWFGWNDDYLSINVDHIDFDFMTVVDNDVWVDSEIITFNEFMQKYGSNTMIEKINQAKDKLKFNNKELSESLGYSRQYITKMLNLPQSEKIQAKVIAEIDKYIEWRDKLNSKNCVQVESFNETEARLCNEIYMLKFEHGKQLTDLQKKLENKEIVINKLDDQLIRAEKVHNEDVKALNEAHSIIHNKNRRIEELEYDVTSNNLEIKELNRSYVKVCDSHKWVKDRIVCERWLFLIIIAILSAVVIFK